MSKASQDAYRKIRAGVLTGQFPAGQFVTEEEFAQFCGLSRTPVREAIAELVAELLLQRSDTNRVFVPIWSDEDEEEMFTLRAMLESHCAGRAARLISEEQITALRAHCDFIDTAIQAGQPDVSGFVEGNRRFHAVILAAAQSERLGQLLRFVVSQVVVHRTAEQYSRADMEQSQRDHRDLVSAFAMRDEAWASAIANTHIRRAANAYKAKANRDGRAG